MYTLINMETMPSRRFQWTVLLVLAALLGGAWIVMSQESAVVRDTGRTPAPIVGHPAPEFDLMTTSGDSYSLAAYVNPTGDVGTPVILNFWATWCGPCRIEMPHLERASQKYEGQVMLLAINQMEPPAQIDAFAEEMGLTFPLLVDQDRVVNNRYGVINLPTTIFIDAKGIVREVIIGTINQAILEDRIGRLLNE
jgi:cytochrome c biogenesis protein CcmG, thiol:disulfide interchange protein DsbE